MSTKKYEVPKDLMKYLEIVLERDKILYEKTENDGKTFVLADAGSEEFDILLEDAECEKQRAENNPDIPVYSYRTMMNPQKWQKLRKLNGKNGCHILKKDERKYFSAVGEEDILDKALYK